MVQHVTISGDLTGYHPLRGARMDQVGNLVPVRGDGQETENTGADNLAPLTRVIASAILPERVTFQRIRDWL